MLLFSGTLRSSGKNHFFAILRFYNFSLGKTKHIPRLRDTIGYPIKCSLRNERIILRKMYIKRLFILKITPSISKHTLLSVSTIKCLYRYALYIYITDQFDVLKSDITYVTCELLTSAFDKTNRRFNADLDLAGLLNSQSEEDDHLTFCVEHANASAARKYTRNVEIHSRRAKGDPKARKAGF